MLSATTFGRVLRTSTVNLGYDDMVFAQHAYRYTANIVIANDHYCEDYE